MYRRRSVENLLSRCSGRAGRSVLTAPPAASAAVPAHRVENGVDTAHQRALPVSACFTAYKHVYDTLRREHCLFYLVEQANFSFY